MAGMRDPTQFLIFVSRHTQWHLWPHQPRCHTSGYRVPVPAYVLLSVFLVVTNQPQRMGGQLPASVSLVVMYWHSVSPAEPRLILCVSLSWSGHCLGSLDHSLPNTDLGSYSGLSVALTNPKAPLPCHVPQKKVRDLSDCYMLDAALSDMLTFSKLPMSAPFETCLASRHQHLYLLWSLIYLQWLGECL